MAYSMDLRRRVVSAVDDQTSTTLMSRPFRVARSTVRDWVERDRRGVLTPNTTGPQGPMKLTADAVAAEPGITAKQLMPMLSVDVVESTVCRALKRLGLSLKRSR